MDSEFLEGDQIKRIKKFMQDLERDSDREVPLSQGVEVWLKKFAQRFQEQTDEQDSV